MEKDRTGFIGSSEISTILGLNPYQTILELWGLKTGQILEKDLSDNEAVEWGKRLEKVVSKKFSDKHKVKLIAYKKRFVHPDYEFLTCELDNIVAQTNEIVEIKTCNMWAYKQWQDTNDIPAHYLCQVMFALGLSNRKVGHIAVLCGGQRYLEKKVIFDKAIFDEMVKKAVFFWQEFVLPKKMPMAVSAKDSETLYQLFPSANETSVALDNETDKIIEHLLALKSDLKVLEKQIEQQENEIKIRLGENQIGQSQNYKATWKEMLTKRLDQKELKEKEISIYNKYLKESKTRVLRISELKEEK